MNSTVQDMLHGRVAAAQSVTDNDQIWRRVQVLRPLAFEPFDALGLQLGAHGRVGVAIRAGNPVACTFGKQCDTTHESSAGAQNVNMHGVPTQIQLSEV